VNVAVFLQFHNSAYRCAQERPTLLPITFFSEVPGSLSDAEVRLFALLMVYHHLTVDDAVLDGWVQRVVNIV
jgi:hypothetical protein